MQASTDSWTAVAVAAAARAATRGSGKKPDGPGGGQNKPGLTRAGESGRSERGVVRRRLREGEAEGGRGHGESGGSKRGRKGWKESWVSSLVLSLNYPKQSICLSFG